MAGSGLGPRKEALVFDRVLKDPARVLDVQASSWLTEISPHPNRLLSRMAEHGLLHRVRRGVYVLEPSGEANEVPVVESLEALAAAIAESGRAPYYLSWHTALFHCRLLEQQASVVYVATTSSNRRDLAHAGYEVRFIRQVPERFFGWAEAEIAGRKVSMASAEKALLDSFMRPELVAPFPIVVHALLVAWRLGRLDADRLVEYTTRYDSPGLTRRVGFLMEHFQIPGSQRLRRLTGRGYAVSLVPGRESRPPRRWEVNRTWGLEVDPRVLYAAANPK